MDNLDVIVTGYNKMPATKIAAKESKPPVPSSTTAQRSIPEPNNLTNSKSEAPAIVPPPNPFLPNWDPSKQFGDDFKNLRDSVKEKITNLCREITTPSMNAPSKGLEFHPLDDSLFVAKVLVSMAKLRDRFIMTSPGISVIANIAHLLSLVGSLGMAAVRTFCTHAVEKVYSCDPLPFWDAVKLSSVDEADIFVAQWESGYPLTWLRLDFCDVKKALDGEFFGPNRGVLYPQALLSLLIVHILKHAWVSHVGNKMYLTVAYAGNCDVIPINRQACLRLSSLSTSFHKPELDLIARALGLPDLSRINRRLGDWSCKIYDDAFDIIRLEHLCVSYPLDETKQFGNVASSYLRCRFVSTHHFGSGWVRTGITRYYSTKIVDWYKGFQMEERVDGHRAIMYNWPVR